MDIQRNKKGQFIKGHFKIFFKHNEETKKRISEHLKGRKYSEKTRKKLSEAHKGKKQSTEHIRKRVEKLKKRKTGKFVDCLNCGNKIYKYPSDLKFLRNFCSFKCFSRYFSENASPKRNNKKAEKEWKKGIYKKDIYTCWICGYKKGKLNAHHLRDWFNYPELRFDKNNGITLCIFCHITYTDFGKH